jgi:hypothetical protein
MKKLVPVVFRVLITSLVVTVVCFFLMLASPQDSARQEMFGNISYYSFAVTIGIFLVHMILLLIGMAMKYNQKPGKEI